MSECESLEDVTIDFPPPIFTDNTEKIANMKSLLDTQRLADIMYCCNTYMIPSVFILLITLLSHARLYAHLVNQITWRLPICSF